MSTETSAPPTTERSARDHPGMRRAFPGGRTTLGLITPLESFTGDVPTMANHLALARAAETAGFASLWVRDVPLLVPGQGDGGQLFDPWVYLGALAAVTEHITLGTASTVLPLRHPVHVAKAAASVDLLSGGRMLLGLAAGDRADEVPAFGLAKTDLPTRLRDGWAYIRHLHDSPGDRHASPLGELPTGSSLLPTPAHGRIPLLMTGRGGQRLEWTAAHADGWLYTALEPEAQRANTARWRRLTGEPGSPRHKPYAQAGYLVLDEDPRAAPRRLPQGWRMGREPLLDLFKTYEAGGVDQLMLNLRFNTRPAEDVMGELASYVLPHFPSPGTGG
ncbi:TIGR03571 family LLM class oxidoreductase [Streptomyces sp. NBC_01218]|uniref:TIGR03571 family LLM class oxidoreductase n=1 Tax=unclassified Streptomyces TaxID=2593676 RepID=UPI0023BA0135|nr:MULTISPECIES: TIGR03571 family LLM class oxidoreductase [unclassified Streptomyces]WEH39236.1 TIGR03571 family LLM class oxidoreductase [Streptomyces sp. AM 2-1-1]WSQ50886.1 TIGR03571 family LLM class oxidoreductase [Streptomyces sp. NBC_01218]